MGLQSIPEKTMILLWIERASYMTSQRWPKVDSKEWQMQQN